MMKKKLSKIIATVLASFMSLTTLALAGCTGAGTTTTTPPTETTVRGLHERTVSETNIDLVKDGKSDYVIVVGEQEENDSLDFAVNELIQNFFKATAISLEVVTDAEVSYTANSKFLSVGNNALLKQAGVTYDKSELGSVGYVVETKGNSVFMVGPSGDSVIYAVYGWLSEQFDYEYYSIGEIYIDTGVENEKLLNVSLKEKPDFDYRLTNFGEAWFDTTVARRSRFNSPNNLWVDFDGAQYHTSFNIVPPDEYKKDHPDWYAPSGEQLCFSRDPEGLAEVVIEKMKEGFTKYPDRNIATFTQQDHNSWCDCDKCLEAAERYGSDSAVYILFVNKVAAAVAAWAEEEYPGREILIAMFAYQRTEDAPVVQTADGYKPTDESLRLHKNVALFYCPIYASYYYDFEAEQNVKAATTLEKWSVLADTLFVWMYGANFQLYLAPYNNFSSMQNNYRYLYDKGAVYLFDQQQFNQTSGTDWYKLRAYVSSNLQWQIDQDYDKLINDFFDNYYKDASAVMKRLFDEENTWFAYLAEVYGYDGNVGYTYSTLLKEEYWPQGLLEGWLELIDEAYKAIEPLKSTDPSMYQTLKDRINLESISFRFMQLEMYSVFYSRTESEKMKESFKQDCYNLGIRAYRELVTIDEYFG